MSIQSELNRLNTAKASLKSLLQDSGITVPYAATLEDYPALFSEALGGGATYLYRALFSVSRWSGSSTCTQTATATPLAGAPALGTDFIMASALFVEDGYPADTQDAITAAGGILDRGTKTFGSGTISCTTRSGEKPDCDVEVYFLAKKSM